MPRNKSFTKIVNTNEKEALRFYNNLITMKEQLEPSTSVKKPQPIVLKVKEANDELNYVVLRKPKQLDSYFVLENFPDDIPSKDLDEEFKGSIPSIKDFYYDGKDNSMTIDPKNRNANNIRNTV